MFNEGLFTPDEDRVITDLFASGNSDLQIVATLIACGYQERTRSSVSSRRARLGLVKVDRPQQAAHRLQEKEPRALAALGDHRFKVAMLAAINAGLEHAILGVVKDRRPCVLATIRPQHNGSLMGSAAAMADDAGDGGLTGWR